MDIKVTKPTTDPTITITGEQGTVVIRPADLNAARCLVLNVTPIKGDVVIEEHRPAASR
jgi:hypothetical protein